MRTWKPVQTAGRRFLSTHVNLKFTFRVGTTKSEKLVKAKVGDTLLEVAQKNQIPLQGACEGNGSCGSCHVVLDSALFHRAAKPNSEEVDLLQAVAGHQVTSRLGCQVKVGKEFEGTTVALPE